MCFLGLSYNTVKSVVVFFFFFPSIFIKGFCENQESYFNQQLDSLDCVRPKLPTKLRHVGRQYVINVQNQDQFNSINELIFKAVDAGKKNILIKINEGIYYFHENHIFLDRLKKEEVSITIKGKKTIITSDEDFSNEEFSMMPWGRMEQADGLIEVVDEKKRLCFIPFKNSISKTRTSSYEKIQITQWYTAPSYDIERIDDDGIYFTAPELSYLKQFGREGYNVNYDFLYAGRVPRFRLYDKRIERPCSASCFMRVSRSSLSDLNLQGISFKGNKAGFPLIVLSSFDAQQITIHNCLFNCIRGKVLDVSNTHNVLLDNNVVTNTIGNEISFSNGCKNVRITNNQFIKCGNGLGNTQCVRCNESEYYIGHNTFCDFGYCGIGVGLWHGHEKQDDTRGIIEFNEIYFTPDYFSQREQFTLMDAGAVYVWTQNDDAIIRYNYIHDYGGMRFNSGIYCDDGASNCKIYCNVILNTPDGHCITSRSVEDQKPTLCNNSNNLIAHNIIDGSIVFEGYGDYLRNCRKGANIIFTHRGVPNKESIYNGLTICQDDVYLELVSDSLNAVIDCKDLRRIIANNSRYRKIKRYLIK